MSTLIIQSSFVNKLLTYTNRYNKTATVTIENKVWTQLALSDLWKLFNFNEVVRKNVWLRSERVRTNVVVIQVLIVLVITIVSVFPNRSSPNRFFNVHRNSTDVLPFLLFFPFKPQAAEQLHKSKPRVTGDKWAAGRPSLAYSSCCWQQDQQESGRFIWHLLVFIE